MQGVLYSYLLQEKKLPIPGVGTIHIDRIPARTDIANRQLLPPFYSFRFDKYFDSPDRDFFTYLAQRQDQADYEAIRWYNEWALAVSTRIRNNEAVEMAGIGILKREPSGEIVLESVSIGSGLMTPVPANKVLRADALHHMIVGDQELTSADMSAYLEEEYHRSRDNWWVYALVAAAIALLILFYHIVSSGGGPAAISNQQPF